jgi:hypothetical protein
MLVKLHFLPQKYPELNCSFSTKISRVSIIIQSWCYYLLIDRSNIFAVSHPFKFLLFHFKVSLISWPFFSGVYLVIAYWSKPNFLQCLSGAFRYVIFWCDEI